MIITCEECQKSYNIDQSLITAPKRKLRCRACGHTWVQEFSQPEKEDDTISPFGNRTFRRPGQAALAMETPANHSTGWLIFGLTAILILGAGLMARSTIISYWPSSQRIYSMLGVPLPNINRGLVIENVTPVYGEKDGKNVLIIKGEVYNTSNYDLVIPPIQVKLEGTCQGSGPQSWLSKAGLLPAVKNNGCDLAVLQYNFSQSRLLAGEKLNFETNPLPLVANTKNIIVQFK